MLSSEGLIAADDHLAALLTLGDPELLDDLAARRLAPLASLTAGARERLELTLLSWLDNQGVVKDAAEALHVHPQTVRYRVASCASSSGRTSTSRLPATSCCSCCGRAERARPPSRRIPRNQPPAEPNPGRFT